jgi:hypothetical protein
VLSTEGRGECLGESESSWRSARPGPPLARAIGGGPRNIVFSTLAYAVWTPATMQQLSQGATRIVGAGRGGQRGTIAQRELHSSRMLGDGGIYSFRALCCFGGSCLLSMQGPRVHIVVA